MDASVRLSKLSTDDLVALHKRYGTNHYNWCPIVPSRGDGVYIWDLEGKEYIDTNSTYSAAAFGHNQPELQQVLREQSAKLTSISNVFLNEHAPVLEWKLCELTGLDQAILMNTGAEAFDTACKIARRWAYFRKGVEPGKAEIVVANNNFHGRTINAISASAEEKYRNGFGPFVPGFVQVPFNDIDALERALKFETAAVIIEPIQGEGGINIPSWEYIYAVQVLCAKRNVLVVYDEVQAGFGRTGMLFAFQHWNSQPDLIMLGKALSGGYYPVSAVVGRVEVMGVLTPGSHGSTFGGNPLGAAIALKSIEIITRNNHMIIIDAAVMGSYLLRRLRRILNGNRNVLDVRGKGLLIGIALDPSRLRAEDARTKLLGLGIVAGAASNNVLRLSPPLTFTRAHVNEAVPRIVKALAD
ncbi:MAG TPA: ornithine--oxo-acid transaminase [Candidatus Paceibacterota bacterium]|nr:ornithine--oxo-acid transaminase [Candidatus Paceibacterota bacterium]